MAFWLISSSSELKHIFYHINRVGVRVGPALAFSSHTLTAHVGPLYERAEADRLFWAHVRESAPMGLTKESGKACIDAAPIIACLRVSGYMRCASRDALTPGLSVLRTKVFRSLIACKTFYRQTCAKTSPILLFWPCSMTASHSKTVSQSGPRMKLTHIMSKFF